MSTPRILAVLLFVAAPAYAQYNYDRPTECWNPGAGHFEQVRPGERQDDLDFSRCRPLSAQQYYGPQQYYGQGGDRARECWNPRAGHYENVREGTFQADLDYSNCRWR